MTLPRDNSAGTTWLVSRRVSERRFFLRPDSFVTPATLFILGYALWFFAVDLHAACVMSRASESAMTHGSRQTDARRAKREARSAVSGSQDRQVVVPVPLGAP